jgi:hypothetical protein
MRLPTKKMTSQFRNSVFLAVVAGLSACVPAKSSGREEYEQLLKLPPSEQAFQFRQLTPTDKVDVYLYSVEHFRPSDYYFAVYLEEADEATAQVLTNRLNASTSSTETFALVYALHGIYRHDETKLGASVHASFACSRFFPAASPCHKLAKDLDGRTSKRN